MAKVVITVPKARYEQFGVIIPEKWDVTFVPKPYTDEELIQAVKTADYLLVGSGDRVSKEVINACSNLKLIQTEGVGFDKVDGQAAREKGIYLCNNKGVNARSVAELTIGLILAGLRRIALADRQFRHDGFITANTDHLTMGSHELTDKLIGFVGMGDIAKEAAKRLDGWGCRFAYYDVFRLKEDVEKEYHVEYMEFDDLVKACDVISMHVPVVPETIGMLGKEQFAAMKKSALVINTARGEVIDQDALVWALENDEIYGAALDVLTPEPIPQDAPIMNMSKKAMDKLTLTPHIGGTSNEAFTTMLIKSLENITRMMDGEEPLHIVNMR